MSQKAVSLDAMWDHIESLAAQHAVKIDTRVDQPADAWAHAVARVICITPLNSVIGYATALHELGHVVLEHIDPHPNRELEMQWEQAAWEWARSNAMVWTPAMECCAVQSLARIAGEG